MEKSNKRRRNRKSLIRKRYNEIYKYYKHWIAWYQDVWAPNENWIVRRND